MKTLQKLSSLALLFSIFCLFAACDRASQSDSKINKTLIAELPAATKAQLADSLLNLLPANALGFFSTDLNNPGYQKLGKEQDLRQLLADLESSDNALAQKLKVLIKDFEVEQIIPENSKLQSMLVYATNPEQVAAELPAGQSELPFAGFLRLESAESAKQLYQNLVDHNQTSVVKVDLRVANTEEAVIIKTNDSAQNFILACSGDTLMISDQEKLLAERASGEKFDFKQNSYASLRDPGLDAQFTYSQAYANVALLTKALPELHEKISKGNGLKKYSDLIPEQVLVTANMKDTHRQAINARLPENSSVIKAFAGKNKIVGLGKLPANTILGLDLSTTAAKHYLADLSSKAQQSQSGSQQMLAGVSSAEQILLGISLTQGATFPDLALKIQSSDPEQAYKLVAGSTKAALAARGLNKLPWQNKSIANLNAEYFSSPFGLGLYLARDQNNVYITSSENALSSFSTEAIVPLGETLEGNYLGSKDKNKVLAGYLNYQLLYKMFKDMRSMLALFIPQSKNKQINQAFDFMDKLKQLEGIYFSAGIDQNILRLEGESKLKSQPAG